MPGVDEEANHQQVHEQKLNNQCQILLAQASSRGPYLWTENDVKNALRWFTRCDTPHPSPMNHRSITSQHMHFLALVLASYGVLEPRPNKTYKKRKLEDLHCTNQLPQQNSLLRCIMHELHSTKDKDDNESRQSIEKLLLSMAESRRLTHELYHLLPSTPFLSPFEQKNALVCKSYATALYSKLKQFQSNEKKLSNFLENLFLLSRSNLRIQEVIIHLLLELSNNKSVDLASFVERCFLEYTNDQDSFSWSSLPSHLLCALCQRYPDTLAKQYMNFLFHSATDLPHLIALQVVQSMSSSSPKIEDQGNVSLEDITYRLKSISKTDNYLSQNLKDIMECESKNCQSSKAPLYQYLIDHVFDFDTEKK